MSKIANLDSLSKVANAVANPVAEKERICARFHQEVVENIKPLFDAYLYAYNKTESQPRCQEVEIRMDETIPSVSIRLYCGREWRKPDNLLIHYVRDKNGYTIFQSDRRYKGRMEVFQRGVSLDDVVNHFISRVSKKDDAFSKAIGKYKEKLERKQKPLLERWGLKKPKPDGN